MDVYVWLCTSLGKHRGTGVVMQQVLLQLPDQVLAVWTPSSNACNTCSTVDYNIHQTQLTVQQGVGGCLVMLSQHSSIGLCCTAVN